MEKRTIEKIEIALEEHEARMVMHCLDYCSHRLKTETKMKGLKKLVSETQVNNLRKSLQEIFNPAPPSHT